MAKTNQTTYQQRVFTVQLWIIEGIPSSLIIKKIIENGWCEERQAKRLLQKARDEWTKIADADMEQRRKIKIIELQQIKRGLKEQYKGTPAGIHAIMVVEKEIIRLEGLAQIPQVAINNTLLTDQHCTVTVEVVSTGMPIARSEDDVVL